LPSIELIQAIYRPCVSNPKILVLQVSKALAKQLPKTSDTAICPVTSDFCAQERPAPT